MLPADVMHSGAPSDIPCAVVVGQRRLQPIELVFWFFAISATVLFCYDMLIRSPVATAAAQTSLSAQLAALDAADDPVELTIIDTAREAELCASSPFDVVLVLGGGKPAQPNRPPKWTRRRCDIAGRLYQCRQRAYNASGVLPPPQPEYILSLSAGASISCCAHIPLEFLRGVVVCHVQGAVHVLFIAWCVHIDTRFRAHRHATRRHGFSCV
jgi:hypothetical protein